MFEDLIPPVPPETGALPPGLFDDLIPRSAAADAAAAGKLAALGGGDEQALPRSTAGTDPGDGTIEAPQRNGQRAIALSEQTNARADSSSPPGLFDDLIPAAARSGAAAGGQQGAVAPEYDPVPDPSLGLKDRKTGIPLVRESVPGRFIADVAGQDDGGLFWKDPQTGEIQRPSGNELIRPEGGKYKVYERDENVRPWTLTDMALVQAFISGFTAPRDAFAGNIAPNEIIPRALDFSGFAAPGTKFAPSRMAPRAEPTSVRPEPVESTPSRPFSDDAPPREAQGGESGGNATAGTTSGDPAAAQPSNYHPPDEGSEGTRDPPPDQNRASQNGAPSGAVSTSWGEQIIRIPSHRIVGRPKKRGQPPIGDDGYPLERHHVGQVQDGIIREMTREDHRLGENYAKNHQNVGQQPSLIDRLRDRANRRRHWAELYDSFANLPILTEGQLLERQRATWARIQAQRQRLNN